MPSWYQNKIKTLPLALNQWIQILPRIKSSVSYSASEHNSTYLYLSFQAIAINFCIEWFKDKCDSSPQKTFTSSKPAVDPVDVY